MKKNILITGTSKGIWNFLTRELVDENNIFCISRSKTDIDWIVDFNFDLNNFENFSQINNYFEEKNIKLDWIILNAGVWYFWKFEEWDIQEYKNIINLNLTSNIILLKKLQKFLNKKSKIIFMGSIISKKFMKYWAVYQASKFWLRWFAWALKNELSWVSVHIINPKIVETDFHNNSKITLNFDNSKYTSIDSILLTVKNIFYWNEKKFEIDL